LGQRIVRKTLKPFEFMAAIAADIFVDGHAQKLCKANDGAYFIRRDALRHWPQSGRYRNR
jgi:hypothetical protein